MIVYDCEIKRAIQGKGEVRLEGIDYCKGWGDHKGMEISVICAYDYIENRYRIFMDDNYNEFQSLVNSRNCIVGYNNIKFDNVLCKANGIDVPDNKSYDLLVVCKAAFKKRAKLDEIIKVNFPGLAKTGHGSMAPVDWQRGKIGSVVDYCMADVWLTTILLQQIINHGMVINPFTNQWVNVQKPPGY